MTEQSTTGRSLITRSPHGGESTDDRNRAGTSARASSRRPGWLLPAGLIMLSVVPVIAGMLRLTELAGGPKILPEDARYFASPLPVVLHIATVIPFALLGAFQFVPRFRRRRPGWHRVAGRLVAACGLVAASTGLWMTFFYPPLAGDGELIAGLRLVFGAAMNLSILLGLAAIRRRDIPRHRAWMIRGYAIGMGAGTQVLTNLPWVLIVGTPVGTPRALLLGAGWVINLAVAEWVIRRPSLRMANRRGWRGHDRASEPGAQPSR